MISTLKGLKKKQQKTKKKKKQTNKNKTKKQTRNQRSRQDSTRPVARRVYDLLVHLIVYFARNKFCPFSLPVGVRGRLQLLIVTVPGHFY